jgi:integrase
VSELLGVTVDDLSLMADQTGRLRIHRSKTDQEGEGALVWLSPQTMEHVRTWLDLSSTELGIVFRRINIVPRRSKDLGSSFGGYYIGDKAMTRQGFVLILQKKARSALSLECPEMSAQEIEAYIQSLTSHSFRVGLTQDLFAAGRDGSAIALALRWTSPATALRYARELAVGNNAAAQVLSVSRSPYN